MAPSIIAVIATNALYGTTLTVSKILVKLAPPMLLIGIRMLAAGTILLLGRIISIGKLQALKFERQTWSTIWQIALFNVYLPYVLRYWSLQYLTVSKTALFFNLTPLVSYVLGYLLGIQKQCWQRWLGVGISFIGFLPMILNHAGEQPVCGQSDLLGLPELAMFGAIASLSYGWITLQQVGRDKHDLITINGLSMLIGGSLSLLTSIFTENTTSILDSWEILGWLAYVIVVTNLIYTNLHAVFLKHFNVTVVALAGLSGPLTATITSACFLSESITWQFYLAVSMLALGIWIFNRAEAKSICS